MLGLFIELILMYYYFLSSQPVLANPVPSPIVGSVSSPLVRRAATSAGGTFDDVPNNIFLAATKTPGFQFFLLHFFIGVCFAAQVLWGLHFAKAWVDFANYVIFIFANHYLRQFCLKTNYIHTTNLINLNYNSLISLVLFEVLRLSDLHWFI